MATATPSTFIETAAGQALMAKPPTQELAVVRGIFPLMSPYINEQTYNNSLLNVIWAGERLTGKLLCELLESAITEYVETILTSLDEARDGKFKEHPQYWGDDLLVHAALLSPSQDLDSLLRILAEGDFRSILTKKNYLTYVSARIIQSITQLRKDAALEADSASSRLSTPQDIFAVA